MSTHSPYGPSASHRWMRCPASIPRSAGLPNRSSPAAEEGTHLHEQAEHWLRHDEPPLGWNDLTEEQQGVVATYVNTVKLARLAAAKNAQLYVEHKFTLKCHPMFFGTADAVVMAPEKGILRVLDLKCGAGVPVEVDYNGRINPQLGYYALGALDLWPEGYEYPEDIEIVVVQPRAGGVKRRKVTQRELCELRDELIEAAELAELDEPPAFAGSHCKFCLAAATCGDLKKYSLEVAKMEFGAEPIRPSILKGSALAEALERASVLESWIKSVREEALNRIKDGVVIPGWKTAPTRPVRKWTDEKIVEKRLADLGMTSIYVQSLVSPAQAEKALKTLEWDFEAQMGDLVEKVSSGERLIHDTSTPNAEDDFA